MFSEYECFKNFQKFAMDVAYAEMGRENLEEAREKNCATLPRRRNDWAEKFV